MDPEDTKREEGDGGDMQGAKRDRGDTWGAEINGERSGEFGREGSRTKGGVAEEKKGPN